MLLIRPWAPAALLLALAAAPAQAADPPFAGVIDVAAGADATFDGGRDGAQAGSAVAFAGDFNHDGHQDYAVSMPGAREVDVVYGTPDPESATLTPPADRGAAISGWPVSSVASAGDINDDGFDDLLVGSTGVTSAGKAGTGAVTIVLGAAATPDGIQFSKTGPRIIRIVGAAGDGLGSSVATVADLDGDRRRDLVLGAANGSATYVVYSSTLGTRLELDAAGTRAYRISGVPGSATGTAVAGTGDMNGDGLGEGVSGAPAAGGGDGAAYVTWGRPPQAAVPLDLAALGAGGIALAGSGGEHAGASVTGPGDATGDGIPDVAVGAPYSSANGRLRSGAAYIVAGSGAAGAAALAASEVRVRGGDAGEGLGTTLAPAGDLDRDGLADLAIGLSNAKTLDRGRATSALLLRTGQLTGADVDAGLLGYAAVRLAGPAPGTTGRPSLSGGVDADGDGRSDLLAGFPLANGKRGRAVLVHAPAVADPPTSAPATATLKSNVEAIVDDSQSMGGKDPGGVLRRQALELVLVNPANQGRIFGAVEFGTFAHQIFPPLRIGAEPPPLELLRGLLAERIRNDGVNTNFAAGFDAAGASNSAAQARIFITDGGQLSALSGFGDVPTYVIGLQLMDGPARDKLARLASDSDGDYYPVRDAGELQSALAAIDARLRGELPLDTTLTTAPGVQAAPPATDGEAAAKVSRAGASVAFATKSRAAVKGARMLLSWDKTDSQFRLTRLRFRSGAGITVRVRPAKLRRALAGRWQRIGRGLKIRGRTGRTFIALDVRGTMGGGRNASAAAKAWTSSSNVRRINGSRATVVRSLWTYQTRPH
jgi:hypothetical protein